MAYKVKFTPLAMEQLESCQLYILYEFNDPFAAEAFNKDVENTIKSLSLVADGLSFCDDETLRNLGYRIIHMKKHRYKFIYVVKDNTVEVHGVYHNLQDFTKHALSKL